MNFCFLYFRCVVFNNRGVSGEMLLVRIKHVSKHQSPLFHFFICLVHIQNNRHVCKVIVKDSGFSHFPAELSFFIASASSGQVSSTRVAEPTGNLSESRTDNVVAQQGLSCRRILYFYFNADPQKYDPACTCCPDTWLNLSSYTRIYLANKMGPSSDSA